MRRNAATFCFSTYRFREEFLQNRKVFRDSANPDIQQWFRVCFYGRKIGYLIPFLLLHISVSISDGIFTAATEKHVYHLYIRTLRQMRHLYTCFQSASKTGALQQFNSPEASDPLSTSDVDIIGVFQIVGSGILLQMGPEGFGSESIHRIILAPELVYFI